MNTEVIYSQCAHCNRSFTPCCSFRVRKPESIFETLIQILLSVKQFKIAFGEGEKREGGWGECGLVFGDCYRAWNSTGKEGPGFCYP